MHTPFFTAFLLLLHSLPSLSHSQPVSALVVLSDAIVAAPIEARDDAARFPDINDLWKRKGGGGGGGKGGAGGGGGGGGGTSSGSSSASRGGGSISNTGGRTSTGSGVKPSYGGGKYYGGGATVPYRAGSRSPLGVAPVFLGVAALAAFPGLWLYGAYSYPYNNPYTFHNRSRRLNSTSIPTKRSQPVTLVARQDDGVMETKPVTCLCDPYNVCGCDDNGDTTFLDSIIGDGSYSGLNLSLVQVADVNGTSTIFLNGTLDNGTTATGGTDSPSAAPSLKVLASLGWWSVAAMASGMVWLL